MKKPPTPNLDEMIKVADDSNKIGAFIDWLRNVKKLSICEWHDDDHHPVYWGDHGINKLLSEYYEINYDEMESKRRAILESLQEKE